MSNPPKSAPSNPPSQPAKKTTPTYVSSSRPLDHIPLPQRLNRLADDIYNFFGLYIVSLFSLDPYTAAMESRFNTRGPGRVNSGNVGGRTTTTGNSAYQDRPRWSAGTDTNQTQRGSGVLPRSWETRGGSGGGGSAAGRRLGTVDDVRGPECGSCG